MVIKEAMKILDEQNFIKLLSELFKHGTALDLVDIDGIRNTQNITDAERYIYDSAEKALDIIDLDELYENAETLGIDEKYPDFFQYLKKLQLEHDDHDERIPSADSADEEGAEIEETDIESEETVSLKDTVTKNLVEGHHTGKESFNEKNQKADELRQKLDEERRRAIDESITADKAADEIAQSKKIEAERRTAELNKQIESENQVQNATYTKQGEMQNSDNNAFTRDSYEESGQKNTDQVKAEYERDTYQKPQERPNDSYGQDGNRQSEAEAPRSDSDRDRADDYKQSEQVRHEDAVPGHTSAETRDTYPKNAGYQRDSYEESGQKDADQVKTEYERDYYQKPQERPSDSYGQDGSRQPETEAPRSDSNRNQVDDYKPSEPTRREDTAPEHISSETRDTYPKNAGYQRDSYEESGQKNADQVKAEYERDTYQKPQEGPSDSYGQDGSRQPETEAPRSDSNRNQVDDYKPSEPARREDTAPEHISSETRDTYPKDAGYQRDSYEESGQKNADQVKAEYERGTYHKSQSVPNNRYEKAENEQTQPEAAKREMIRKDVNNVHIIPEIRQRETGYKQDSYETVGQNKTYTDFFHAQKENQNNNLKDTANKEHVVIHGNPSHNNQVIEKENDFRHQKEIIKNSTERKSTIANIAAGAAATAAAAVSAKNVSSIKAEPQNIQKNESAQIEMITANDLQKEFDSISSHEASAMANAINRGSGDLSLSNKDIADSYFIANQIDSETAKINNSIAMGGSTAVQNYILASPSFGFDTTSVPNAGILKNINSNPPKIADVGTIASRQGNQVTLFINNRPKQFTIRSGGTISVNGLLMNVYKIDDSKVFVGWKNAAAWDGIIVTPSKAVFEIVNGTKQIKNAYGLALEIKGEVREFSEKIAFLKSRSIRGDIKDAIHETKDTINEIKNTANTIVHGVRRDIVSSKAATRDMFSNVKSALNKKSFHPGPPGKNELMVIDKYDLMPISFAPCVLTTGIEESDLKLIGNTYVVENFVEKKRGKSINDLLRKTELNEALNKQGKMLHVVLRKRAFNFMRSVRFTDDDIKILAANYDRILSMNCRDAALLAKMNKELEFKYLGTGRIYEYRNILKQYGICTDIEKLNKLVIEDNMPEELKHAIKFYYAICTEHKDVATYIDVRERLQKKGIVTNRAKLEELIKNGKLSGEDLRLAQIYVKLNLQTREDIIKKGILNGEFNGKMSRVEDAFLSASIPILMQEHGIPTGKIALAKFLKRGQFNTDQLKLIRSYILVRSAARMWNHAQKIAKTSISGVKKIKSAANKYMGGDYTMRGLMMLGAVLTSPAKAVRAAKKSFWFGKNTVLFAKNTVKTGAAVTKTGYRIGKLAGKNAIKSAKFVKTHGVKGTAKIGVKNAKYGVRNKVKKTFKMLKTFSYKGFVKNKGMSFLKTIARVLQVLVTSLLSILLPIVVAVILILVMIFSFLAFIKNSGDEVYYDAGDEDTTEVVQEMVDVLTLCHATFRSALSNQFGGGSGGGSASGTDEMNAPQLQKGDKSNVSGLYDVQSSSWWNYEFTYQYIHGRWAAGTNQKALDEMFDSGKLTIKGNGNYAFVNNKMYMAAFGSYWGKVGDVLKVEFNEDLTIGDQPATNTLYIIIADEKAWKDTGYPEQKEGLYGHRLGGHRDFAEFIGYGAQPSKPGTSNTLPMTVTNMGSILDGTCDMSTIGATGMSASASVNADIIYRQEIDQDVYRNILNRDKNIYYTFPQDQEMPDGITPTPTPIGYDESTAKGEVYGFYNNNQELISMVLAMFDFDINSNTSVKQTVITTKDTSGVDDESVKQAFQDGLSNKINADTWKLITYFDENGLDLTNYTIGGYDDLKYSTLVGLFNASHIVTGTKVIQYHQGADGLPTYDNLGKPIDETNTDGMSYQVPVMETYTVDICNTAGVVVGHETHTRQKRINGELCFRTLYTACPGHTKYSAAVITLHFNSLLNIKNWWKKNIYDVDNFDKENPNYESKNSKDANYKAKSNVLKRSFQYIKKPDFYKGISGTCEQGTSSSSSSTSSLSPGTMTESQAEVAKKINTYLIDTIGLTQEQSIGVLVNIYRESSFDYTALNSIGAYGICQWLGERRVQLQEWCNSHNLKYNTLDGQLSYLQAEFTVYTGCWTNAGVDGFKKCTTAAEAGEYFLRYFERPGDSDIANRVSSMDSDIAMVKGYLN